MSEAPDEPSATHRLRLRRLGILLAFVAFLAACFWVRNQLEWINQRRAVLALDGSDPKGIVVGLSPAMPDQAAESAPWVLRMLGEGTVAVILIDGRVPVAKQTAEMARLKELFPEASVEEAPPRALLIYDDYMSKARAKRRSATEAP